MPAPCDRDDSRPGRRIDVRGTAREAELEALARLGAIRDVCDALVVGHWPLDSGLILLLAELLDQAGVWAMVAEAEVA